MNSRIIVALDFQNDTEAFSFLEKCDPNLCRVKIGKGMFTRYGATLVKQVIALGFEVFLDLKFHDIPNTVYDACRAAADLGVWMLNVHALGGLDMMQMARKAVSSQTKLIAVTLLTSHNIDFLKSLQIELSLNEMVVLLAKLAESAELDGVVASAHEAREIKSVIPRSFEIVTPGIRLDTDDKHDQVRIMTPKTAVEQGADYLVIGRSITQAISPIQKMHEINQSLTESF
jgi:orotidine-5'-phosphate decarboxylase